MHNALHPERRSPGKAFLWVFKLLYELGKVVFILFLVWLVFVCLT